MQSVYFLRDLRSGNLTDAVANNCLMCGRCEQACPVGIEQNTLRLNSRQWTAVPVGENRYGYIRGIDRSQGNGKVGYFAGCMTLLTPKILRAMDDIFKASGDEVWWADKEGGVCCGRPLKLSGEVDAARKMMEYNTELFRQHGIETLVTSCPICLRVFREDYRLEGIEVLHHSEYIQRLLKAHRIDPKIGDLNFTYHDPCELGRGSGIYDAPREVIAAVGRLTEVAENREKALCCGSSLANIAIDDDGQPLPPPGPMRSSRPVRCARKESPGAIRCLFTILRKSSPKHYDTGRSGGCCDRRQESPPVTNPSRHCKT